MSELCDQTVAVIGGGVSGIAAAHYLLKAGLTVDLFEADRRLGGRVCIDQLNGREVCFGGKNIGYDYREFRAFLETYAYPDYEYFGINSARLVKGKIKAFNSKKPFQKALNILNATTPRDLIKLKKAMSSVKSERDNGDISGPYFQTLKNNSHKTIEDYFSKKLSRYLIRALTVRMNGAEPSEVSIENLGTHLQMLKDEYEQLTTPLSDVFDAFRKASHLRVFTDTTVNSICAERNGYLLETDRGIKAYQRIIIALPASAAQQLLKDPYPDISNTLNAVRYFPVGVIIAQYKYDVFQNDIRALTFGPDSPLSNIGAYGINDLNLVRYTFSGQASEDILHETLDDRDLLICAEAITRPYFNLTDNELIAYKSQYWASGLCGYALNEAEFQSGLKAQIEKAPGLYLTGDYIKGASIENCFRASKSAVAALLKNQSHFSKSIQNLNKALEQSYVQN